MADPQGTRRTGAGYQTLHNRAAGLVGLRVLLGRGAGDPFLEMTPDQARALAASLEHSADRCEGREDA